MHATTVIPRKQRLNTPNLNIGFLHQKETPTALLCSLVGSKCNNG